MFELQNKDVGGVIETRAGAGKEEWREDSSQDCCAEKRLAITQKTNDTKLKINILGRN